MNTQRPLRGSTRTLAIWGPSCNPPIAPRRSQDTSNASSATWYTQHGLEPTQVRRPALFPRSTSHSRPDHHTPIIALTAGVVTLTIRDVPTSTYARTHTLMPVQPSIIAGHHILCYPGSREDLVRYPPRAVWTIPPPGNPTAVTATAQYSMGPSAAPSYSPATLHLQIALGSATAGMQENTRRATAPQAGPYPAPRQQEQGPSSHHMQTAPSSAVVQGRSTRTDDAHNARPAPGMPYPPTHAAGTTKSKHAPPTSDPPAGAHPHSRIHCQHNTNPPAAPAASQRQDPTPAERAAAWSKYLSDVLLLSKRGPDGAPPQLPAHVVAQELGRVLGEIEAHRDEMNVEAILVSTEHCCDDEKGQRTHLGAYSARGSGTR